MILRQLGLLLAATVIATFLYTMGVLGRTDMEALPVAAVME